jgi:hypothetical protein
MRLLCSDFFNCLLGALGNLARNAATLVNDLLKSGAVERLVDVALNLHDPANKVRPVN